MFESLFGPIGTHIFCISTVLLLCITALLGKVNWAFRVKGGKPKKLLLNFAWIIPLIAYLVLFGIYFVYETDTPHTVMLIVYVLTVGIVIGVWVIAPQVAALHDVITMRKAAGWIKKYLITDTKAIEDKILSDVIVEVRNTYNILQVNDENPLHIIMNAPDRHTGVFSNCYLTQVRGFGLPVLMGYHFCEDYAAPVIDIPAYYFSANENAPKRCALRMVAPPSPDKPNQLSEWIANELYYHSAHRVMEVGDIREFCYLCEQTFSSAAANSASITMATAVELTIRAQMR